MVGAKKALKRKDVWAIRFFLEHEGRLRDRAMFDLAIDSKLRRCDVVEMKIGDLVAGGSIRHRVDIGRDIARFNWSASTPRDHRLQAVCLHLVLIERKIDDPHPVRWPET